MAMSQQDSFLDLVCWSGVRIKQKDRLAQRAKSIQDISSAYGLQTIPSNAVLVMWAQASLYLKLIKTSSKFSGQRAGI